VRGVHGAGRLRLPFLIGVVLAVFARAVELDPTSIRAHESLGTALWRQGRDAEAGEHFRRAAALGAATAPGGDLGVPPPGADAPTGS
jgi:hypothetical protein